MTAYPPEPGIPGEPPLEPEDPNQELQPLMDHLERSYDYELEDEFPELDEEDYPRD